MANTKEEKIIYKDRMVTIEYTAKAAFNKKGTREEVHEILAEKLEKKGVAKIIR